MSLLNSRRGNPLIGLLRQQAEAVSAAAQALRDFLWAGAETGERQARWSAVREAERRGDELEREVAGRLARAFLLPVRRGDIYAISGRLESIMDILEGVADRVELYAIGGLTPEVLAIADVLPQQAAALVDMVEGLQAMSHSAVTEAGARCRALEAEVDRSYRAGVARLFRTSDFAALEVLKLKEVLERLEEAADHCEDVSRVVEGILIQRR